jgi:hypothetical protein
MRRIVFWATALLLTFAATAGRAAEATSAEIYAQALRIEQEVELLKRHFKIAGSTTVEARRADIRPRHIRAATYILQFKIGKLRRQHGLAYIQTGESEPSLDTRVSQPWGTLQRILTEIQIFKYYADLPVQVPAVAPVAGKRPIDVFNKLRQVSVGLDQLTSPVSPSEVYGEVKRLHEDVNAVLRHLHIFERAVPPPRQENLQPKDSLRAVFALLAEIERIQRSLGLQVVDLKNFDIGERTVPDDVFWLIELALAEWQRVKAQLGMIHTFTVAASFEENKTPSDVVQLLGYVTDKLRAIDAK